MGGINFNVLTAAPWETTEIFTVGCNQNCKGCINKFFQDKNSKHRVFDYKELAKILFDQIQDNKLSISGGEPFLQAKGLTFLLKELKSLDKNKEWIVLSYSGYTLENLLKMSIKDSFIIDFLKEINILVDGPYNESLKYTDEEYTFIGSSNQRVINVPATLRCNFSNIILYN